MIRYKTTPKFDKEFKKLFKKYKTLDQDFVIFQQLLIVNISNITLKSSNHHAILHTNRERSLYILKSRLQCRALRRTSLRIIYQYTNNTITFIEIYFKGNKPTENVSRWQSMINY